MTAADDIKLINEILIAPSAADLEALQARGHDSWGSYFVELAEATGVTTLWMTSTVIRLGLDRAFTDVVTAAENAHG